MPRLLQVDLWPFDLESKVVSESHVTLATFSANFSLPRPLCSRLWPDVRDRQTSDVRQTDVRHASSRIALYPIGRGIKRKHRRTHAKTTYQTQKQAETKLFSSANDNLWSSVSETECQISWRLTETLKGVSAAGAPAVCDCHSERVDGRPLRASK